MAQITLDDLSLREHGDLGDFGRLTRLRNIQFDLMSELCIERPRLITEYLRDMADKDDPPVLRQAKALKHLLDNKKATIWHTRGVDAGLNEIEFCENNLLAGSTTMKAKGVPIHPQFFGLAMWPELPTVGTRDSNPYYISEEDIEILNFEVFPYWMDKTILEYARNNISNLAPLRVMMRVAFFICSKVECISHTIPDYSRVVNRGLNDIIAEAEEKMKFSADKDTAAFYEAVKLVLEGVINYAHSLSDEAKKLAAVETDEDKRRELEIMADVCSKIPAEKPSTFREALNAVWICEVALHQEHNNIGFSIGRLDQVLYDLYRQDIDSGELTVRDAIELLGCFWLKCGDHVPMIPDTAEDIVGGTGSNQAITIGGITPDGQDAVNDLTYVMLKTTEIMKVRDPNVNARIHLDVNPPEYLRRVCEANLITGATPCMHNDLAAIPTLINQGVATEHANDYASVGCVEPNSAGRTYGHTGSLYIIIPSALELVLYNGKHRLTEDEQMGPQTGDPRDFKTFEEFMAAFETQLKWLVDQSVELNNELGKVHQKLRPTPLLSALFEGPMRKGKDVIEGGALYNFSGATIIGFADAIDSLSAIEAFVYCDKVVSMDELIKAIDSDFASEYEPLQMQLLNRAPKYGTENPIADKNAQHVVKFLHDTYQGYPHYRGGKYTVGYWTMTMHAGFGMLLGAHPNGRPAGESFSSGITPVSGATKGLTACLNSIASLDSKYLANGVALNLKYTPDPDTKLMLDTFSCTVEAYFRKGGLQVQFNIITRDTLINAMKSPQDYRDLLVRVSGYTAYFRDLNDQMKREIINRSEYDLKKMEAVPYPLVRKESADA